MDREKVLKLRQELIAKENAIAHKERQTEKPTNFTPVQHEVKRPRPKTKDVPNVIQHSVAPKRTENKW